MRMKVGSVVALGLGFAVSLAQPDLARAIEIEISFDKLTPLQVDESERYLFNTDFDSRAEQILNKLKDRFPSEYVDVTSYLEKVIADTTQPRQLSANDLAPFLCVSRRSIARGESSITIDTSNAIPLNQWFDGARSEGLPAGILPCTAKINQQEYVVTNVGQNIGYDRGASLAVSDFDRINGSLFPVSSGVRGGLAQYFVALLTSSNQIDFRSWARYRIADFILFQLEKGQRISDPDSVVFDFQATVQYFEARFNPRFYYAPSIDSPSIVFEKTFFEPNLITYEPRFNVAVDFPVLSLEGIVGAIARLGEGVAYDRSGFEQFIGTFTYPWQILFHIDVNPQFASYYRSLFGTAAFNDNWLIWANFIAGNGDADTLRNSTFFRSQFSKLVIEGAIQ